MSVAQQQSRPAACSPVQHIMTGFACCSCVTHFTCTMGFYALLDCQPDDTCRCPRLRHSSLECYLWQLECATAGVCLCHQPASAAWLPCTMSPPVCSLLPSPCWPACARYICFGSTLLECCEGQLDYQSTQQHKITQTHVAQVFVGLLLISPHAACATFVFMLSGL